ncbi:MAG: folate family ECF transporter S component [Clostridiales bacterium]|nr:folate family ECF transporter S component [Clostridiales bacterium]
MLNLLKPVAFDFVAIFGNVVDKWYFYLALIVFLALLTVYCLVKKPECNALTSTQKLVYTAILSALCFMANYFTIKVSDLWQISLVSCVGFIAGYLLGGGYGFAAAFIGDLICGIVAPFGAYNPIIGMGTGLFGFVPGVIFSHFRNGNKYVKVIISFAICFLLNSFVVNTLGLSLMYGMSFESLLVLLPLKLATTAVNMVICILAVTFLPKILPRSKFFI